jgi:hypothetical protein
MYDGCALEGRGKMASFASVGGGLVDQVEGRPFCTLAVKYGCAWPYLLAWLLCEKRFAFVGVAEIARVVESKTED